jgi:hypothetical protein
MTVPGGMLCEYNPILAGLPSEHKDQLTVEWTRLPRSIPNRNRVKRDGDGDCLDCRDHERDDGSSADSAALLDVLFEPLTVRTRLHRTVVGCVAVRRSGPRHHLRDSPAAMRARL